MSVIRRRWVLRGIVQGVGFRPHVATTASRFPITGFCGNNDKEVFIEAQGTAPTLDDFFAQLLNTLPPLAHVIGTHTTQIPPELAEAEFRIIASEHIEGERTLIPPDVATCKDCLAEMQAPRNRRYKYPFTNCTNCGPRLSIIVDLPYDRPSTTMAAFPMCPECLAEYQDIDNRRYHAQPISCPNCGPRLWLEHANQTIADDPISAAQELIDAGHILAVKGIGGFHLMCDARNEVAVAKLRERKHRPAKPFAVMVPDDGGVEKLAQLSEQSRARLESPAHPIVIAPMAEGYDLAASVALGVRDVGVVLPYSPLHALLVDRPMIATSGNASGEPLCFGNDEALEKLSHLADAFLLNDRDIHVPVEDSVFLEDRPVRRSRGYAPIPVPLPDGNQTHATQQPTILAVGGELKNTFTLANGDLAHVSTHIGDMGSWASQQAFEAATKQMLGIQRVAPELVVCDLHPNYATTAWAERYCAENDVPLLRVQHHYAHALSLLTEQGHTGSAVIATLDGTGYGTDGSIWGGEILRIGKDHREWERAWHVPEFPLVGGDRAVRLPWRLALGICHAWGLPIPNLGPDTERQLVLSHINSGVQCTSLGRLFDAASAILNVCQEQTFEAQAAMELEALAREGSLRSSAQSFPELFTELFDAHFSPADRAHRFHHGLARLIGKQLLELAGPSDLVGVTGGCALNRLFMYLLAEEIDFVEHTIVPANDGGLSLGQAVAGRLALRD